MYCLYYSIGLCISALDGRPSLPTKSWILSQLNHLWLSFSQDILDYWCTLQSYQKEKFDEKLGASSYSRLSKSHNIALNSHLPLLLLLKIKLCVYQKDWCVFSRITLSVHEFARHSKLQQHLLLGFDKHRKENNSVLKAVVSLWETDRLCIQCSGATF